MNIFFTGKGWEQFEYWVETDKVIVDKVKDLIRSIIQTPFKGLGKLEPLKHKYKGYWSRRITQEHRLVYKISGKKGENQMCTIIQCRFHYDDK